MKEKFIDIKTQYSHELSQISNRLNWLEAGLITDLHPRANMYGYLSTNIIQLRKDIGDLLHKIEYGLESIDDEISKAFFNDNEIK